MPSNAARRTRAVTSSGVPASHALQPLGQPVQLQGCSWHASPATSAAAAKRGILGLGRKANLTCQVDRCSRVNRYRLIHADTGADLGPLVSDRDEFRVGEILERLGGEQFLLVNVLPAINENFRGYLVVRTQNLRR